MAYTKSVQFFAERIALQPASCLVETTKPQDNKHSPQHHMADSMGDRDQDQDKTTTGQSFWSWFKEITEKEICIREDEDGER